MESNKNENSTEKKIEELIEKFLPYYEWYLEYLSSQHKVKFTDMARIKNVHEFKALMRLARDDEHRPEIFDTWRIDQNSAPSFEEKYVEKNKAEIEIGKIIIFPVFQDSKEEEEEIKIQRVLFLKKKDFLWGFGQRVKRLVDWCLPNPIPQET